MRSMFVARHSSLRRILTTFFFAALGAVGLAPSAMADTVMIVQVRTDLIPGTELGWMRARFHQLADDGTIVPENAVIDRWKHHSDGSDWAGGVRIAESPALPDGSYWGEVFAYTLHGSLLVSRPVRVDLASGGIRVLTVLLTRDPLLPPTAFLPAFEISHWTSDEVNKKDRIECPVNLAMNGLGCNGSFCDNVRIHCRAVPALSTETHRWTAYFSDENASFEGCTSNEFATGLQCRGQFCDEIRLRCTQHMGTEESCYTTDLISEDRPLTEFVDQTNGLVRRILCEGSNCDDKRLEICRLNQTPMSLGAFPALCVTSNGGSIGVADCLPAGNGANVSQIWKLNLQAGRLENPVTGTCLTATGGIGNLTEEPCVEAGDTNWFLDPDGRMSSLGPNSNPLCLNAIGVQDPVGPPPLGTLFELGVCSKALYQLFTPSNAGLPAPLPEFDAGMGEAVVPVLSLPTLLFLVGAMSAVGVLLIQRSRTTADI